MAAWRFPVCFALIAAAWSAAALPAMAQTACGPFTWVLGKRVDVLAGYVPGVDSGHALPKDGVFDLRLRPREEVVLPVRIDGPRSGNAGFVTFESVPEGRYRVVHAQEARVTAVQNHALVPLLSAAGYDAACPAVYRGIELVAEAGPLTVQITEAASPLIRIALVRLWR